MRYSERQDVAQGCMNAMAFIASALAGRPLRLCAAQYLCTYPHTHIHTHPPTHTRTHTFDVHIVLVSRVQKRVAGVRVDRNLGPVALYESNTDPAIGGCVIEPACWSQPRR